MDIVQRAGWQGIRVSPPVWLESTRQATFACARGHRAACRVDRYTRFPTRAARIHAAGNFRVRSRGHRATRRVDRYTRFPARAARIHAAGNIRTRSRVLLTRVFLSPAERDTSLQSK